MNCMNCGKQISKDLPFCPHCGKAQEAATDQSFTNKDPFEILQISKDAEMEVIKAAHSSLAKKYQPDTDSTPAAEEKLRELTWAFEQLSDPTKRQQWIHRKKEAAAKVKESPEILKKIMSFFNTNTCLDCGTKYDHTYRACPNCKGVRIKPKFYQNKLFWIIGVSAIIITVLIVILGSISGDDGPEPTPTQSPTPTINFAKTEEALAHMLETSQANAAAIASEIATTPTYEASTDGLCCRWDEVRDYHVGTALCVYGEILEIRENVTGDGYLEYVIRFSIPDKFLFKSIKIYYPSLEEGGCYAMIGEIRESPNYFFMQSEEEGDVAIYDYTNCGY